MSRDTWVSEVGQEADGNNGGAPQLKLKSIQEMTLIDVEPAPLRGRAIAAAALHLKSAGDPPLRRVTVGGIGAQWFEGSGSGYASKRAAPRSAIAAIPICPGRSPGQAAISAM